MFGSYIPTALRSVECFFDTYFSHVYVLWFYLRIVYLAETENFFAENVKKKKIIIIIKIKLKVSWIVQWDNTKKCNRTHK